MFGSTKTTTLNNRIKRLKELCSSGIENNESQFLLELLDYCKHYIMYKHKMPRRSMNDIEEVASYMMEEFYKRLTKWNVEIKDWKVYSYYVFAEAMTRCHKMQMKEVIDLYEKPELEEGIWLMSRGGSESLGCKIYSVIDQKVYLDDFTSLLNEVMELSPFHRNTVEYSNLRISVSLSFLQKEPVYYNIDDDYKNYVCMLWVILKDYLAQYLFMDSDNSLSHFEKCINDMDLDYFDEFEKCQLLSEKE